MFRLKFTNSNDVPIFVQIDPWAGLYKLCKGDEIEFAADGNDKGLLVDVEEDNDTRIVTLWNSVEYFIVREGQLIHWKEFPTNIFE
jgi:hypothetical protein